MAYLTLAEYQSYGGTLVDPAFSRAEFKARTLIDQHTFGRLKTDTQFSEAVKRLTFELIGLIGNADISAEGYAPAVKSEGNDGYSISYFDGTALTLDTIGSAVAGLIDQYLTGEHNQAGVSLLCRWA